MKRIEYEHYRKKQLKNEAKNGAGRPKSVRVSFILFQVLLVAVFVTILSYAIVQTRKGSGKGSTAAETDIVNTPEASKEAAEGGRGTEDVLLFGVKKNDTSGGATRDYLMVCHIDYDRKTARLATIYRDFLMEIPDNGDQRVMNAYTIDGPQLVLDTVNKNLDLDISRYAVIYYDDRDTLQQIYDAAMAKDTDTLAHLTSDMLDTMDSNTNTEHERKWVGALGNFDVEASKAYPEHFYGGDYEGTWVEVPVTLTDSAMSIHTFLYPDESYTVSDTVQTISNRYAGIAATANDDLTGAP